MWRGSNDDWSGKSKIFREIVRFEVLTATYMKMSVSRDIAPCGLVDIIELRLEELTVSIMSISVWYPSQIPHGLCRFKPRVMMSVGKQ